jgi:flagellar basal-body rod protein FlgC
VITFKNSLDRATGLDTVRTNKVVEDKSEFVKKFDPNHPAADQDGYVQTPNVNTLIEMMDMREAQRSYEANLNVIKSSKAMLNSTIDVLRR